MYKAIPACVTMRIFLFAYLVVISSKKLNILFLKSTMFSIPNLVLGLLKSIVSFISLFNFPSNTPLHLSVNLSSSIIDKLVIIEAVKYALLKD